MKRKDTPDLRTRSVLFTQAMKAGWQYVQSIPLRKISFKVVFVITFVLHLPVAVAYFAYHWLRWYFLEYTNVELGDIYQPYQSFWLWFEKQAETSSLGRPITKSLWEAPVLTYSTLFAVTWSGFTMACEMWFTSIAGNDFYIHLVIAQSTLLVVTILLLPPKKVS